MHLLRHNQIIVRHILESLKQAVVLLCAPTRKQWGNGFEVVACSASICQHPAACIY